MQNANEYGTFVESMTPRPLSTNFGFILLIPYAHEAATPRLSRLTTILSSVMRVLPRISSGKGAEVTQHHRQQQTQQNLTLRLPITSRNCNLTAILSVFS